MSAQVARLDSWAVDVVETELSVTVRVEGSEWSHDESRRARYHVKATSALDAQNIVANRIHRAMLGFPQDPAMEGGRQ